MKKEGYLHALVSATNSVDLESDVICFGAFEGSLMRWHKRRKWPVGVFSHDLKQPIAKTIDAWEDQDGLHVFAVFNLETQRGREVFSDVLAGVLSEYSIGFQVRESDRQNKCRMIRELEWLEWSPVVLGAHPSTKTFEVGDYEKVLRSIRKGVTSSFLKNEFALLC